MFILASNNAILYCVYLIYKFILHIHSFKYVQYCDERYSVYQLIICVN